MIDIHSHILPCVDDGSRSMDESLEMLRVAVAGGTTDIVATPHASPSYPYNEARIRQAFDELRAKMRELITIHLGCDFHLDYQNLADCLTNPCKYTINGGRYLMVELPDVISIPAMRQAVNRLIASRIHPVITHPERNISIQSQVKELAEWVDDGCLLQITGQSLLGRFGSKAQRACESLLDADLVHFVASDAHDTDDRTPDLREAFERVKSQYGKEKADALFISNPRAVVTGEPVLAGRVKQSIFGRVKSFLS